MTHRDPPESENAAASSPVAFTIDAKGRDLGNLMVRRALPSMKRRMVGPFVFFDHMGPAEMTPGQDFDVRPHPHIGLATVTYLFEGKIFHRDTLGSARAIEPGAINWMVAGRGIAHSERTPDELRSTTKRVHGIQLWVALPLDHEENAPSFDHHPSDTLPSLERAGVELRVLLGEAYGASSPVKILSPLFYVEAKMPGGSELTVPDEHEERAAYVAEGEIECAGERATAGRMMVFARGAKATLRAVGQARVMLLGGAPLEGPRHIWWNFVSSSEERIEQAKRDWKDQRFGKVPGDESEFIPLPES